MPLQDHSGLQGTVLEPDLPRALNGPRQYVKRRTGAVRHGEALRTGGHLEEAAVCLARKRIPVQVDDDIGCKVNGYHDGAVRHQRQRATGSAIRERLGKRHIALRFAACARHRRDRFVHGALLSNTVVAGNAKCLVDVLVRHVANRKEVGWVGDETTAIDGQLRAKAGLSVVDFRTGDNTPADIAGTIISAKVTP